MDLRDDPGEVTAPGRELLGSAWSLSECVWWSLSLTGDDAAWGDGLDRLLGMPEAAEDKLCARLVELVAPLFESTRLSQAGDVDEVEQPCELPGGQLRLIRFRAQRQGDARTGRLVGIATIVRDPHKQELADVKDRYRLLVELSPEPICVHQDGINVYVNPATVRMLGVESSSQLIGLPITEYVAEASMPAVRDRLAAMSDPDAGPIHGQFVLRRADGSTVVVEAISAHTTWRGRPAVQTIMRDVTAQQATESALRYQAALIRHVSNAIIGTTHSGVVTSWNPAAESIYQRSAEEAIGRQVGEVVGAPLNPAVLLAAGGVSGAKHMRADGSTLTISVSVAPMDSGFVLVCADETALRKAQQHYATVVDALDEGVVVVGTTGLVESVNPAALQILGADEAEMIGSAPASWSLFDEAGGRLPPHAEPSTQCRHTGRMHHARLVRATRRNDGQAVWLSLTTRTLNLGESPPHRVVLSFTDITEARAIRERLEWAATHDPLTGLANRTLLLQRLNATLHARQRTGSIGVLFIDLDHFKLINDSLGHSVGDDVLRVVGERLRQVARHHELVGRLGGDEFVVVSPDENDPRKIRQFAEQLRRCLIDPIQAAERELHIDTSVGIVLSPPDDTRRAADVLRDADVAMYQAKKLGRGRCVVFDVRMRKRAQRNLHLEQDLRQAIARNQLWMAFQPIVDLRTGRVVAAESLLRWRHPVYGMISPAEFIPLAEETDLINQLGIWALQTATREIAAHRRLHNVTLGLKVNLSVRQLECSHLLTSVHEALAESNLPPSALCLELTESALMLDPTAAGEVLSGLRQMGVKLAIDDFGTGYSSLAQLHSLPLNTLKIDRSFIAGLGGSSDTEALIAGIVAMAHALKLNVIAEGIETAEQLDTVRRLGCDHAQGFYLGKPAPIDELGGYPE